MPPEYYFRCNYVITKKILSVKPIRRRNWITRIRI